MSNSLCSNSPKCNRYNWFSFEEACEWAKSSGIKSETEWKARSKVGQLPERMPSHPYRTYKSQWTGWGNFLGTRTIAPQNREWLSFKETREWARTSEARSKTEWCTLSKAGLLPINIPGDPRKVYKGQWTGWGDFLGTGTIATFNREFLPFKEARKFVRTLGIKNLKEWQAFSKAGLLPKNIPSHPDQFYKGQFKGWGDWLGTGRISNRNREYLSFKESREWARSSDINSKAAWYARSKAGLLPVNIPGDPREVYKDQWNGWGDFLGTGRIATFYRKLTSEQRQAMYKAGNQRRRVRKKAVPGDLTPQQIMLKLRLQRYRCYYAECGYAKFKKRKGKYIFDLDHTNPISRPEFGPQHTMSGTVLACPTCNGSKKDKLPHEWPAGGRLL